MSFMVHTLRVFGFVFHCFFNNKEKLKEIKKTTHIRVDLNYVKCKYLM